MALQTQPSQPARPHSRRRDPATLKTHIKKPGCQHNGNDMVVHTGHHLQAARPAPPIQMARIYIQVEHFAAPADTRYSSERIHRGTTAETDRTFRPKIGAEAPAPARRG